MMVDLIIHFVFNNPDSAVPPAAGYIVIRLRLSATGNPCPYSRHDDILHVHTDQTHLHSCSPLLFSTGGYRNNKCLHQKIRSAAHAGSPAASAPATPP